MFVMFTGLIQQVGRLERLGKRGRGAVITVKHGQWSEPLVMGESVAVEGVCLTVSGIGVSYFSADVLGETLSRTTLGSMKPGSALNLERSLKAGDRIGGHIVTGHIDSVGKVSSLKETSGDRVLEIFCPPSLMPLIADKGSVAVNGVSLTVAGVSDRGFRVYLIPATWNATSLSSLAAGAAVNIETDVFAKYIAAGRRHASRGAGISMEFLRKSGLEV